MISIDGKRIWTWIRERDVLLILFSLALALFSWVFIETTDEMLEGDSLAFDEWAIMSLRNPEDPADPWGPPWMEEAVRDISAMGGAAVLSLITGAFLCFLALIRHYRTLVFVLFSIVGGLACSSLLKSFFARPRPDLVAYGSQVMTYSFPSGHSMISAIVYVTLGALVTEAVSRRRLQSFFIGLALLVTILVGLGRVYLGVHYPTDVLAGWCAGLAWAALCSAVARLAALREKDEDSPG